MYFHRFSSMHGWSDCKSLSLSHFNLNTNILTSVKTFPLQQQPTFLTNQFIQIILGQFNSNQFKSSKVKSIQVDLGQSKSIQSKSIQFNPSLLQSTQVSPSQFYSIQVQSIKLIHIQSNSKCCSLFQMCQLCGRNVSFKFLSSIVDNSSCPQS